jgi:hypothetical protein
MHFNVGVIVTIFFVIIVSSVIANPMFYKRNQNDNYEPGENEINL